MRLGRVLRNPFVLAGLALGLLALLAAFSKTAETSAGFSLLRLGLALLAILALMIGAVPSLRRLPMGSARSDKRLCCRELLALDNRHRLALVSVDGRELLLGLQAEGFVLLRDLGEGETATVEGACPSAAEVEEACGLMEYPRAQGAALS